VTTILWKLVFVFATAALGVGVFTFAMALPELASGWVSPAANWIPFLVGAAGFFAVWGLALRRWGGYRLLTTLDHELLHAAAAALTGGRVSSLSATAAGQGAVTVQRPNPFVALAPYLLSWPLLGAGLLALVMRGGGHPWLTAVLGAATAYHLIRVASTCRPGQPDFRHTTYPLGLLWTVGGNALLLGAIAAVVGHGG